MKEFNGQRAPRPIAAMVLGRTEAMGAMRESELLAHIAARSADLAGRGGIVVGPGDDAALVQLTGAILLTVDQLIAGRHFDPHTSTIDQIARKSVARSVSDIAAMAGAPLCGLATGCLPDGFAQGDELFDRMAHWARHFGCPLVGGDVATAPGPLMLTVTVLGRAHARRGAVLRSDAAPGDHVYVTGRLGGSFASGRYLSFEPRVREATWLADMLGDRLGAMIDLSDGLGRDAGRIAAASGVQIELEPGRLPLHAAVREWERAMSDGEDYELLFTVRPDVELPNRAPGTDVTFTRIGSVRTGSGCGIRWADGSWTDVSERGWDHTG